MQKGNNYTVGQWCDRWFCENRSRWSGSTVGGYRNLIYRHIFPGIGNISLAELDVYKRQRQCGPRRPYFSISSAASLCQQRDISEMAKENRSNRDRKSVV